MRMMISLGNAPQENSFILKMSKVFIIMIKSSFAATFFNENEACQRPKAESSIVYF